MAPAATPPQTVARLNQSLNAVLIRQDVQEVLAQLAYAPPPPDTPEALGALIVEETGKWMEVLRQHNIIASPLTRAGPTSLVENESVRAVPLARIVGLRYGEALQVQPGSARARY